MKDLEVKNRLYSRKGSLCESRMGPGLCACVYVCVFVVIVVVGKGGESKVNLKSMHNYTSLVPLAHPQSVKKIQKCVVMKMDMTLTSSSGPLIAPAKTQGTRGVPW